MDINFSPRALDLKEARGLVALLVATHGEGVLPGASVIGFKLDASGVVQTIRDEIARLVPADAEEAMADTGAPVPATDSTGLPWDERIHSSSKALNADGTWRYRKGVGADVKAAVEAELRGPQPQPVPMEPPPPAPAAVDFPPPPSSIAPVAPPPPPAEPVSPPPVATVDPFTQFVQLVQFAGLLQKDGKATLAQITEAAQQFGAAQGVEIKAMVDLKDADKVQHVPAFREFLQSLFGG